MERRRFLLVLSATIAPHFTEGVLLRSPAERRRQYLEAFNYWLDYKDPWLDAILFIDNSGSDLTEFETAANRARGRGRNATVLSMNHGDSPPGRGKGYGEFRMLDAMIRSGAAADYTYIVKITGRLLVTNLADVLRYLPDDFDLAADLGKPRPFKGQWVVDTRLMIIRRTFYEQELMGLYQTMNDASGFWAELAFGQFLVSNPEVAFVPVLPAEPRWVGVGGSTGQRYDSLLQRAKYFPRQVRRWLRTHRDWPGKDFRTVPSP